MALPFVPSANPYRPVLDPAVERHHLAAGGSLTLEIGAGEGLEIVLDECGQSIEIAAFAPTGADDLAALDLVGRPGGLGVHAVLSSDELDARRVRNRLARRGIDLAHARTATLFGPDAGRAERASLTATRDLTVFVAAPAAPMTVWDQTPPGGATLHVRRGRIRRPNDIAPADPLAEPLLDMTVDIASARSFEVKAGDYIQVMDVAGRQCSDFVAFRKRERDRGLIRGLDATTTRTMNGHAYPTPGLHSKFFDEDRMPLVEVVHDTVGRHDTFNLACTARYYEDMGYFGHANCSDNFNAALATEGIAAKRGWPAINFFFNTNVDAHNTIWFDEPWSRPGDYVLMRALDDLVCAVSSCPSDIDAANGWMLTPIQVRIYPGETLFKRAIGYRMTPDAPMTLTRETGFHPRTSALTGHFTEYRNFWLPWNFRATGAVAEYRACREAAAIMDLSALRKLEVVGPDAETLLQGLFTRDVRKLAPGQVVYGAFCYEHGGMVDDGTLFRLGPDNFRWIGGDDAGLLWLKEKAEASGLNVHLRTATDQIHNVAVQGPKAREILADLIWTSPDRPTVRELGWFRHTIGRIGGYDGIPVMVSRTGYTGELGFEIFCHPKDAPAVWDAVMAAGAPHGLTPLGFEALDMLRIEAGLVFGGHDFDTTTDPFEAGIGFAVPAKKEDDYVGKAALERRRATPARALVGLRIDGREVPSHGDPVFVGRAEVGIVTSATRSPILDATIALARVDVSVTALGTALEVGRLDGRLKRLAATVTRFPFYDPDKSRVRA